MDLSLYRFQDLRDVTSANFSESTFILTSAEELVPGNWIIPETLKKLDSWDYQSVQKTHDMLSWFDRIHKRDRQT